MQVSALKFGYASFSKIYTPQQEALDTLYQQRTEELFQQTFDSWYRHHEEELKGFLSREAVRGVETVPGIPYEIYDLLMDIYRLAKPHPVWKELFPDQGTIEINKLACALKKEGIKGRFRGKDLEAALQQLADWEVLQLNTFGIGPFKECQLWKTPLGQMVVNRLKAERDSDY